MNKSLDELLSEDKKLKQGNGRRKHRDDSREDDRGSKKFDRRAPITRDERSHSGDRKRGKTIIYFLLDLAF